MENKRATTRRKRLPQSQEKARLQRSRTSRRRKRNRSMLIVMPKSQMTMIGRMIIVAAAVKAEI